MAAARTRDGSALAQIVAQMTAASIVYEQIKNALNQGRLSIHILLVTG